MNYRPILAISLAVLSAASFGANKWLTSYTDAAALSKKTGKPIMAYFTGSDWCIWCHRLDNEVLDTPTFEKWADKNVVLLMLDFPQSFKLSADLTAQNDSLQAKYQVVGYPTIHVLDYKGDDMANQGYEPGGPNPWIDRLQSKITDWMNAHPDIKAEYARAATAGGYTNVPAKEKPLHAKADVRNRGTFDIVVDRWLSLNRPNLDGKVILLELFNTTSDAAAKAVPALSDWSKQFSNDLDVLAVSNESAGPVLQFMHQHEMPYFVGLDTNGVMAAKLGIGTDPYFLVLSPDGIVRWQGSATEVQDALTAQTLQNVITDAKQNR